MRLFIGLPIADETRAALRLVVDRLRTTIDSKIGKIRWTDPEGWHITLQFLGNCNEQQYEFLVRALRFVPMRPFQIEVDGLDTFERAGVLFAGVRLDENLAALQHQIVRKTTTCGFASDDRPYHPHITLARTPRGARISPQQIMRSNSSTYRAENFCLYESVSGGNGPQYLVKAQFPNA
jgi:2'-5' RNA ligase